MKKETIVLKSADPRVVGRGQANFVDQGRAFVRLSTSGETRGEESSFLGSCSSFQEKDAAESITCKELDQS